MSLLKPAIKSAGWCWMPSTSCRIPGRACSSWHIMALHHDWLWTNQPARGIPVHCSRPTHACRRLFRSRASGGVSRSRRIPYPNLRTSSRTQLPEVRFDQVAGCLRSPVGGSSRQSIVVVDGGTVRSRLLSPREAARLMGVPESYPLPKNYNEAYHLFGDGVAVPVVSWLEKHLLRPLALSRADSSVPESNTSAAGLRIRSAR